MSTSFTEDTRPIRPVSAENLAAPPPVQVDSERRRRRKKRGPKWVRKARKGVAQIRILTVLLVIVVVAAVLSVGALVVAADAQTKIQSAYSNLERVLNDVSRKPGNELTLSDFNLLQEAVNTVAWTLYTSREQVSFLHLVSRFNSELEATLTALDISVELSYAAREMLNGIQPTLFFLFNGESEQIGVTQVSAPIRTVELLQLGQGQFASAQFRLTTARDMMASINLSALPPSSLLALERLRAFNGQLDQINNILLQMPDLLETAFGLTGNDSNYLVLAGNNDEIRPSGGFISTYGWLVVDDGRITNYDYLPSGGGNPRPPPESMADQVETPDWWIRSRTPIYMAWDGSWYADFPSTARMAVWFYNNGRNPRSPVNGVISIDIDGFLYLLEALGDVPVPEYGVTVNPSNFRNIVYDIRAYAEGQVEPHKAFVAAVYRAIFTRWQDAGLDAQLSSRVLGAALRALQEKHLMLYFTDERLNEAVDLLGWGGVQQAGIGHDYLLVADANLGNKSNNSIVRELTYDVDLRSDGTVNSRATILYDYPERLAANDPAVDEEFHGQRDYFNMLQVFTPLNAQLTSTSDTGLRPTQVYNTPTHTDFVTLLMVPYNLSERYQLSYTVPNVIEPFGTNSRYRLLLQKQPGTDGDPVNVQITLPPGATVLNVTPQPSAQYFLERQLLEFQINLTTDRWIDVIYALPAQR